MTSRTARAKARAVPGRAFISAQPSTLFGAQCACVQAREQPGRRAHARLPVALDHVRQRRQTELESEVSPEAARRDERQAADRSSAVEK